MSDDDDYTYEMLMPFVTVKSAGGPHDDASYVAGFEMGELDMQLSILNSGLAEFQIHSDNTKQADLIAMKHGFKSEITVYDECPEWSLMVVTKELTTRIEQDK